MKGGVLMNNLRKVIAFTILIMMCVSLMAGCGKKQIQSQKASSSKLTQQEIKNTEAIFTSELKYISKTDKISIVEDKPCMLIWVPQKQTATLSEVTSWLQQAVIYECKIPKPKNLGKGEVISNAYTGPSVLDLFTSNNHRITIEPACYGENRYINNVLEFDFDGQKTYIESGILYKWLKDDNWKTEFKKL